MNRYGVVPDPNEGDRFITDVRGFLKSETSQTLRWETADDVIRILKLLPLRLTMNQQETLCNLC